MLDTIDLPHPTPPVSRVPFPLSRAAVLGAGAWGTALAAALQRAGVATTLWARRTSHARQVHATHRHDDLPGIDLPASLAATSDLATALHGAQLVLLAVPASATRGLASQLSGLLTPGTLVLTASKGFERETGAFMTEVLDDALGRDVLTGALSGPSFAIEVARGEPTLLTLAMATLDPLHPDHRTAQRQANALTRALAQAAIRVETTSDVVGVQVGGALKNQVAIACGMATALGMGENARAGILSRGLDDMRQLTLALGGRADTLLGSCGVGDLFLTASSTQSRNTRLGMRVVREGATARLEQHELAEGAISARTVIVLERELGIRLELAAAIRDVFEGIRTPAQALASLLEPRPHTAPPRPLAGQNAPAPSLPALLRPLGRSRLAPAAMPRPPVRSHA